MGSSPQPTVGPHCTAGLGASTVSGLKAVPGHARLQRLGKERAGGESACPESVRNGAVWVCQRDSGLSPGSPASLPTPPHATVQQSLSGPPQPSPQPVQPGGGRSRRRRGASAQASQLPGSARGRARVTPHAGPLPGGHLAPGPAEHRGPVPWGECPQMGSSGRDTHSSPAPSTADGPRGEGRVGRSGCRWGAGLPPPVGNKQPARDLE